MNATALRTIVAGLIGLLGPLPFLSVAVAQPTIPPESLASAQTAVAAGHLRVLGDYAQPQKAWTSTVLPDGNVLMVGSSVLDEATKGPDGNPVVTLRNRLEKRRGNTTAMYDDPLLWRADKAGWQRLPRPPACPANYFMPNATLLKDGRVLFTGGLCDLHRMGDDKSPYLEHVGTAIWNTAEQRWQSGPELKQTRVWHTATLLWDGSVMLVGGLSDPALAPEGIEPVLDTVELFVNGTIQALPPLSVARAGHTATLLPDGSVLVVGGFDAKGRALASAELWDPSSREWRRLPPMADARYAHGATLLADGRVLVTGGQVGPSLILARSEIYDPSSRDWRDAILLPRALREHMTLLLPDGAVLLVGGRQFSPSPENEPWVWLLDPQQQGWQAAGNATVSVYRDWLTRPELQLLPDGRVRIFAGSQALLWQRRSPKPELLPPSWTHTPAITLLAGGQVLVVGTSHGPQGYETGAYLWDPASRSWSDAGHLEYAGQAETALIQLPSGRVVHVGTVSQSTLVAECWKPPAMRWTRCGEITLAQKTLGHLETGLLPSGRMLVVPSLEEGLAYHEGRQTFEVGRLRWRLDQIVYGAPWIPSAPLALFDDGSGSTPVDVSPLAAHFWEAVEDTRRYVQWQELRRVNGARLHWNQAKGYWTYVLRSDQIGRNAILTPDGCAISVKPLTLVDTNTSKWRPIADPGLGMEPSRRRMIELPGGYVAVVGVPRGGVGPGFYYGRASCAGLSPGIDEALSIHARYLGDRRYEVPAPAPATTLPVPVPRNWRQRLEEWWPSEPLWILTAVLIPLFAYFLLRRVIQIVLRK